MDLSIISSRTGLPKLIQKRLGETPVHYAGQSAFIRSGKDHGQNRRAAGVLIPICFKEIMPGIDKSRSGFVIQLIRRSSAVAQSGDLSGPGGMLNHRLDGLLRLPLAWGITPILRGKAKETVRSRGAAEFEAITLFLANALRESWEELRLNPFNVEYLGALPFQNLIMFTRTIFPLVGLVKKNRPYRPNREVERIVEIPLEAFFDEDRYAACRINNGNRKDDSGDFDTTCVTWESPDGVEEILWGATLGIILDFLYIVFDYEPPKPREGRMVVRTLSEGYMKGKGPR